MKNRAKLSVCCVCQYPSKSGTRIDGQFTCTACDHERIAEEERMNEDAEWYEVSRVGYQVYRVVS